jgi:hypothetical protein
MNEKKPTKKHPAGDFRRKGSVAPAPPTQEEIGRRAHEISVARGGEPGRELDDWLQAERELREGRVKA